MQNTVCESPNSIATGQVGQTQPFLAEIHIKLFPVIQKSSSCASFAHRLYVGHEGHMHMAPDFLSDSALSAGDIPVIDNMVSSNVSRFSPSLINIIRSIQCLPARGHRYALGELPSFICSGQCPVLRICSIINRNYSPCFVYHLFQAYLQQTVFKEG